MFALIKLTSFLGGSKNVGFNNYQVQIFSGRGFLEGDFFLPPTISTSKDISRKNVHLNQANLFNDTNLSLIIEL